MLRRSLAPALAFAVLTLLAAPALLNLALAAPADTTAALPLRTALLQASAAPAATGAPALLGRGEGRSIPLAFGLSALVPGLGQAYNRQWIKAASGVALEVALIVGYAAWRQDGLDGRDAYQAYAHDHWQPAKYGAWINDYKAYLDETGVRTITAPDAIVPAGIDFTRPEAWTVQEEAAVRDFFNQIRAIEAQAVHLEGPGASFSHQLPYFAEQQYYELIGKYFQFAPGWEDYESWREEDGAFNERIDPEMTGEGGGKPNVSSRFWTYADDHADANDQLRLASRVSGLLVLNHLFYAIDAAVFSKIFNDRLDAQVHMALDGRGAVRPSAALRVRL